MKRLITAVLLLCLILGISSYSFFSLEKGIEELSEAVQALRYHTPAEELEARSQELVELWNQKERTFVVFVRHDTLDEVTQLLAELPSLAEYQELGSFYSRVDSILARLDDLADSARPSYRNLL